MQNLALIKAEHFQKIASQVKTSSVGSALLDAIGLGLIGAAAGGTIGGAMEHDPHMVHESMARGALIGGGIGGTAPILGKILGAIGKTETQKGFDRLVDFRNKTSDEILNRSSRGRASGMA